MMPFRQIVIHISPGLRYVEQIGTIVKFVYSDLPTMYIHFRLLLDATNFFNDSDFSEGENLVASEAKAVELIQPS